MVFKSNWEKTDQYVQLPEFLVDKMCSLAFPGQVPNSHSIISGGCANLNIKLSVGSEHKPFILRIYLRDQDASFREQKLGTLLKNAIPIPLVNFVGDCGEYHFAIAEYMPGITLRDLLLGKEVFDIEAIMHDVGSMLVKIQNHHFQKPGFFDRNLHPINALSQNGLVEFARGCLKNKIVIEQLGVVLISKISSYLDKYRDLFPDESNNSLVHGDFDPANILVEKQNGIWKITGVLDWEFAFSGSMLCDVANMLRYTHQMPSAFETAFLKGLSDGGIHLPDSWRTSVQMLNLLSLLDCLVRGDPKHRPNQCADICALIENILTQLDLGSET